MANEARIKKLLDLAESCTDLSIDELVKNKDWGSINFEDARNELDRLYSLLNHLKSLPLDQLPDDVADLMHQEGAPIQGTIQSIKNFSIERDNPADHRNNLVGQVKTNTDRFYKATHIYIPYLAYQRGEVQKNIRDLTQSVQQAKNLVSTSQAEVEKTRLEIDEIIKAAREASASVGVAHFTTDFNKQHEELESTATKWLFAAGISAIATISFGLYFLNSSPILETTAQAIHYVSSKLVILGVLLATTAWCAKIYKAVKHQSTTNKFRSNALRTFQAFVKASSEGGVRDAVLLETTRAIFSESPSGYLDSEPKQSDGNTRILEIAKSTAPAAQTSGQ